MKGSSDLLPEKMVESNNKKQFRYNITPFEKEMMGNKQKGFDYFYVELEGEITRSKLIDAIISNVYSKDKELALINNEINSPGTLEYKSYQDLRSEAKIIADDFFEFYS